MDFVTFTFDFSRAAPFLIGAGVIFGILIIWYIAAAIKRSSNLSNKTSISMNETGIHGNGYVGALGMNFGDVDQIFSIQSFYFRYDEILSADVWHKEYIQFIVGSSQWFVKCPTVQVTVGIIQSKIMESKSKTER